MPNKEEQRIQAVKDLTSNILHRHYCENNVEAIILCFSRTMSWFGAAEQEYLVGYEKIVDMFRQFAGKVPLCHITDEHYDVIRVAEDVYVCTGMLYIFTDPSTNIYLRVHQRITTVVRWEEGVPKCCHLHISNPYTEMTVEDVGFPTAVSNETRKYMLEQLNRQAVQLEKLGYEDLLTGMYNRNKFNRIRKDEYPGPLGLAVLDINGLKEVNDRFGHETGDKLIVRVSSRIRERFENKCFRVGGDEFVVVEKYGSEEGFRAALELLRTGIEESGDSISIGISWRDVPDFDAQLNEADNDMYENKRNFYTQREHDRRKRRG